jgi:hypothetical protein
MPRLLYLHEAVIKVISGSLAPRPSSCNRSVNRHNANPSSVTPLTFRFFEKCSYLGRAQWAYIILIDLISHRCGREEGRVKATKTMSLPSSEPAPDPASLAKVSDRLVGTLANFGEFTGTDTAHSQSLLCSLGGSLRCIGKELHGRGSTPSSGNYYDSHIVEVLESCRRSLADLRKFLKTSIELDGSTDRSTQGSDVRDQDTAATAKNREHLNSLKQALITHMNTLTLTLHLLSLGRYSSTILSM